MKYLLISILLLVSSISIAESKQENGRYQIVQPGDVGRDQYLLDTKTGLIRRMVCASREGSECLGYVWQIEQVEGLNIKTSDLNKFSESPKPNVTQFDPNEFLREYGK